MVLAFFFVDQIGGYFMRYVGSILARLNVVKHWYGGASYINWIGCKGFWMFFLDYPGHLLYDWQSHFDFEHELFTDCVSLLK